MSVSRVEPNPGFELPFSVRIVLVFAAVAASAALSVLLTQADGKVATIWLSNGLLTGILLLAERRRWPAYLIAGYLGAVCADLLQANSPIVLVLLPAFSMAEVAVPLVALRSLLPLDFTRRGHFARFAFYGILLGPLLSATGAGLLLHAVTGAPFFATFQPWLCSDILGMAIVPPIVLSFWGKNPPIWRHPWRSLRVLALLTAVTVAVFAQSSYPLLFALFPVMLLAALQLGMAGSAVAGLLIGIVGLLFTSLGRGPLTLMHHPAITTQILLLQFCVALALFTLYMVAILQEEARRMQRSLTRSEQHYRLLAEHARDVIFLVDVEGRSRYVSPAVTQVLGWTQEELTGRLYTATVYPADLAVVKAALENIRRSLGCTVAYRCRRKDGDYLWMEANLSLYRDAATDEATGLVSTLRDISDRKAAEIKLQSAYRTMEELATVDALTGIANRRRLEEVLTREWRRSAREGKPLSLLLLDVDEFKAYNDRYGHLRGDSCLKQVAEAAQDVVQRPADLVARFGGEEFAIVLPDTDERGAAEIGEQVRRAVERRALPHSGSAPGVVTVSIGSATLVPQRGSTFTVLIETADRALYRAKRQGRNCVVPTEAMLA